MVERLRNWPISVAVKMSQLEGIEVKLKVFMYFNSPPPSILQISIIGKMTSYRIKLYVYSYDFEDGSN